MYQDLCVAFNSLVKLLIRPGRLVNADFVRDNEAWVCSSSDNQIAQIPVVLLDVTLTGANGKTLELTLDQHLADTTTPKGMGGLTFSNNLPKLINIIP